MYKRKRATDEEFGILGLQTTYTALKTNDKIRDQICKSRRVVSQLYTLVNTHNIHKFEDFYSVSDKIMKWDWKTNIKKNRDLIHNVEEYCAELEKYYLEQLSAVKVEIKRGFKEPSSRAKPVDTIIAVLKDIRAYSKDLAHETSKYRSMLEALDLMAKEIEEKPLDNIHESCHIHKIEIIKENGVKIIAIKKQKIQTCSKTTTPREVRAKNAPCDHGSSVG
jgi:hypothetical protein